jgi:hypothetical protein
MRNFAPQTDSPLGQKLAQFSNILKFPTERTNNFVTTAFSAPFGASQFLAGRKKL